MNNTKKSGFTLIELLVVVAIIGILASLVIASLNQARSRGVDAAIKGTMSSMRAQAELFYDTNNAYFVSAQNEVCTNASFMTLRNDVDTKNGGAASDVPCYSSNSSWAAGTALTTSGVGFFCVDSSGFAGIKTTILPANTLTCSY